MISKHRRSPSGLLAAAWWLLLLLVAIPILQLEFRTTASWYGPSFQGRKTASGDIFDQNKLTAASRTLPFGTRLTVQNMQNGKSCEVVINDRGPYVSGRGLDLSLGAARQIDMPGVAPVLCYTWVHDNSRSNEDFASRRNQSPPLIATRPSRSLVRHRREQSVRYVAYEGSQRTVFDGTSGRSNRFVHTYRG
jgi:rare lipoprotein A (peptidoglycan hydrolase)